MHRADAASALPTGGADAASGFWLRTREIEQARLVLWLPVLLATGIGVYFALPDEPERWIAPAFLAVAVLFGLVGRAVGAVRLLAAILAAMALGFALAQTRAHEVAAPVVERRMGPVAVAGRIVAIEPRADGVRMLLDRLSIAGFLPARTPETIRLKLDGTDGLRPGDDVRIARAYLSPPPAPSSPGAFDFARQAWFERLGAVGYARGRIELVERPGEAGWRVRMNALRADIVARIAATLPDPAGAIAAALIAGEQGAVPPEALAAFRDSGLQHILSISGLHIGMVAGIVFAGVRVTLALVPAAALRWNTKKIAAVASFAAITFYMLFAVPSVPTQRSWLMTSVVLFAVLIDRRAITLRLVAWAAGGLLVAGPESLLSASFQMSFAAVAALVAAFEVASAPMSRARATAGPVGRAGIWLAGTVLTSLVAGFASAPFALYHFNRFSAFGLIANLLAVPLTGIWIMPWAVAAGLLFPFGLEAWALVPMGWGLDALLWIARWVAGWDGAVALFPSMPAWGLAAIAAGLAWLCLWRSAVRLAGVAAMAAGLATVGLHLPPDILVSGDGRLIAVRDSGGRLLLSSAGGDKFARETWLRRDGTADVPEVWPRTGTTGDGSLDCRAGVCVYRAGGMQVSIVRDARVLPAACGGADLVVATVSVRAACRSMAGRTIDRFDLLEGGAHAIWIADGHVRVETVREWRGARPWVPDPPVRSPSRVMRAEPGAGG
ncbi:MAG: ComEC/Rec2 family competence protein [Rhodospirillales bacterium]|nr:ComEC/Rec2 family competence protein [Rhodospirillales bacterium]